MPLLRSLPVTLLLLIACWQPAMAAGEGDRAPAWTLETLDGEALEFPQATGGRPSIVLFWATWCPYCRALMPHLEEIRAEYATAGVEVFAINIKEDGDPQAFAAEAGFDFRYLLEGDPVAESYSVRFTPGLFVIDGDGMIVFRRRSTELPPGREVAEYWSSRVRAALDGIVAAGH